MVRENRRSQQRRNTKITVRRTSGPRTSRPLRQKKLDPLGSSAVEASPLLTFTSSPPSGGIRPCSPAQQYSRRRCRKPSRRLTCQKYEQKAVVLDTSQGSLSDPRSQLLSSFFSSSGPRYTIVFLPASRVVIQTTYNSTLTRGLISDGSFFRQIVGSRFTLYGSNIFESRR